MALPTAYLTSTKNLPGILSAIQAAQAPSRFTVAFLEGIGYKSSSDRLVINVLKALGFLSTDGVPTQRYYDFLDQIEAPRVLGEALQDAYADIFQLNRRAHQMSRAELKNKFKTITQGKPSDDVLGKMATTFVELAKHADFTESADPAPTSPSAVPSPEPADVPPSGHPTSSIPASTPPRAVLGGLVYNIQIHLPESRDQAVYDAIFRSIREHLAT